MGMTMTEVDVKKALLACRDGEVVSASCMNSFVSSAWRKQVIKAFRVEGESLYYFNLKNGDFVEVETKGGPYDL